MTRRTIFGACNGNLTHALTLEVSGTNIIRYRRVADHTRFELVVFSVTGRHVNRYTNDPFEINFFFYKFLIKWVSFIMAEAVGFEPTIPFSMADFKSAAINRTRPRFHIWSGRQDLNLRHLRPKRSVFYQAALLPEIKKNLLLLIL
jgi:hypothetical protein